MFCLVPVIFHCLHEILLMLAFIFLGKLYSACHSIVPSLTLDHIDHKINGMKDPFTTVMFKAIEQLITLSQQQNLK